MQKPKIGQIIIYKGMSAIIIRITELDIYLSTGDVISQHDWNKRAEQS